MQRIWILQNLDAKGKTTLQSALDAITYVSQNHSRKISPPVVVYGEGNIKTT
jgi:hypothetical protein